MGTSSSITEQLLDQRSKRKWIEAILHGGGRRFSFIKRPSQPKVTLRGRVRTSYLKEAIQDELQGRERSLRNETKQEVAQAESLGLIASI